jgi:hypothetical protein
VYTSPGGRGDDVGVERLEEVPVHRRDADLLPREVRLVDLLVGVDVKGLVLHHAGQVHHVALLVPDLVDGLECAVLALLRDRYLGQLEEIGLRHHVGIERPGVHRQVHDAGLDGVTRLERRDGLGAAEEVDLQQSFSFGIDLLDPGLKPLDVDGVFSKSTDQAEGCLLRGGCERHGRGEQQGCGLREAGRHDWGSGWVWRHDRVGTDVRQMPAAGSTPRSTRRLGLCASAGRRQDGSAALPAKVPGHGEDAAARSRRTLLGLRVRGKLVLHRAGTRR